VDVLLIYLLNSAGKLLAAYRWQRCPITIFD